jgi:hypothetical protein
MPYLTPDNKQPIEKSKSFNGLRRTRDGMLYLTSINPNIGSEEIIVSNYYEDGKSDLVARDETDYIDERLELFDVQYFTGDGATFQFDLSTPVLNETRIALFLDGVRQEPYTNFTLVNNTEINFTLIPVNNASIVVGQIKKRYFNNDSDRYQQINYSTNSSTTFLINSSSGDLVKRTNQQVSRSALVSDDFDTFESTTASVNTTSYQSAV